MLALSDSGGVLLRSDETDIINYLRESERLRQRRAKIEEIRAKMRAQKEREDAERADEGWEEIDAKGDEGVEKTRDNKKNGHLSMAGDFASAVGSGCRNASGVFKQMNKTGKPIYKHISGGKMGMRQINKFGKKAIFKPSKSVTSSVANGVGKVAFVAAVAIDGCEIGTAIKQDYEGGTMHNTVHTSSGVAGSWAGAVPGAMYGASLGSVVPVAGSLIGGIVGGVIGSLGGGFLARKAAETVMPAPGEKKEEEYEEKREEEVPGQCVLCRLSLAGFDLFYEHFVECHPDEWLTLFSGVVGRAGEERMDIEDTWFVSKAFVCREEEIEQWGMEAVEDILSFNDRILLSLGWDGVEDGEEQKEQRGWTMDEKKEEEEEYGGEDEGLPKQHISKQYEHSGALVEVSRENRAAPHQPMHGGLLSVL
ncbi:hypothetical protein PRIPAC_72169 [Pristionchus pacificus]|uniref:Uncharacterized protein n=1 Tax=Pristionchus pacificus TaxID=54126 RepID=A0A2A6C0X1_PRIPA|nr:hypothetical protein PRIPAC_72169 [Pristionchus pacificus]|eukprot:PDM71747.1 hypothetical protein PRIPAC_38154 [Pristionchus pacificus]